jgi:hypothetical protein
VRTTIEPGRDLIERDGVERPVPPRRPDAERSRVEGPPVGDDRMGAAARDDMFARLEPSVDVGVALLLEQLAMSSSACPKRSHLLPGEHGLRTRVSTSHRSSLPSDTPLVNGVIDEMSPGASPFSRIGVPPA